MHYFGSDTDAALAKYLEQRDDLQAGRTPRTKSDGLTVRNLANRLLTSKKRLLDSSQLSPRMWSLHYTTCETLVGAFSKTRLVLDPSSEDFEELRAAPSKTRGPHARSGEIQRSRHETGTRMVEAAELRTALDAAPQPMRAMILLAVNCGFGQTDVANLPIKSIDLKGAWVDHPRPKTAVVRRCPLWPETVDALRKRSRRTLSTRPR